MNLAAIREARAAKVANMRQMLTLAESEKRALNAQEQTAFDGLKVEITTLEQQEARAQFLEDAERRKANEADREFNKQQRARMLTQQQEDDAYRTEVKQAAAPLAVQSGEVYQPAVDDDGNVAHGDEPAESARATRGAAAGAATAG